MVALFLRTELPAARFRDTLLALLSQAGLPERLITTGPSGDLVVLEGHARLTAYMLCPDRLAPELEVLVGSSPGHGEIS